MWLCIDKPPKDPLAPNQIVSGNYAFFLVVSKNGGFRASENGFFLGVRNKRYNKRSMACCEFNKQTNKQTNKQMNTAWGNPPGDTRSPCLRIIIKQFSAYCGMVACSKPLSKRRVDVVFKIVSAIIKQIYIFYVLYGKSLYNSIFDAYF